MITMDLGLKGKKAFVSGSTQGIGLGIAKALHQEGCSVALNGRSVSRLAVATKSLQGSVGIRGDVSRPKDASKIIRKAVVALGGLDILVCNVGSGSSVSPGKEDAREWQRVFGINLWSATNLVEAAQKYLIASKGTVVCVSSICGLEVVPGAPVTYSAAKAALHAMIRGLARPMGKMGVRINGVAAGNIIHENSVWARKLQKQPLKTKKMLSEEVALQRLGKPGEVADLVAFLTSRRASFANGAVWVLDGGQNRS